jgi:hypothetical protein
MARHTDRIAVVVGYTEVEHRAGEGGGLDGVLQGGHLMPDRFDDDVGLVDASRRDPAVAGGAHGLVDPEIPTAPDRSTGSTPVTWAAPNAFAT